MYLTFAFKLHKCNVEVILHSYVWSMVLVWMICHEKRGMFWTFNVIDQLQVTINVMLERKKNVFVKISLG